MRGRCPGEVVVLRDSCHRGSYPIGVISCPRGSCLGGSCPRTRWCISKQSGRMIGANEKRGMVGGGGGAIVFYPCPLEAPILYQENSYLSEMVESGVKTLQTIPLLIFSAVTLKTMVIDQMWHQIIQNDESNNF